MSTVTVNELQKTTSSDALILPDSFTNGRVGLNTSNTLGSAAVSPFTVEKIYDFDRDGEVTIIDFDLPASAYATGNPPSAIKVYFCGIEHNSVSSLWPNMYFRSNGARVSDSQYSYLTVARSNTSANYYQLFNQAQISFRSNRGGWARPDTRWYSDSFKFDVMLNPEGTNVIGASVSADLAGPYGSAIDDITWGFGGGSYEKEFDKVDGISFNWSTSSATFTAGKVFVQYISKLS